MENKKLKREEIEQIVSEVAFYRHKLHTAESVEEYAELLEGRGECENCLLELIDKLPEELNFSVCSEKFDWIFFENYDHEDLCEGCERDRDNDPMQMSFCEVCESENLDKFKEHNNAVMEEWLRKMDNIHQFDKEYAPTGLAREAHQDRMSEKLANGQI